jgi:hypothetical protein
MKKRSESSTKEPFSSSPASAPASHQRALFSAMRKPSAAWHASLSQWYTHWNVEAKRR